MYDLWTETNNEFNKDILKDDVISYNSLMSKICINIKEKCQV